VFVVACDTLRNSRTLCCLQSETVCHEKPVFATDRSSKANRCDELYDSCSQLHASHASRHQLAKLFVSRPAALQVDAMVEPNAVSPPPIDYTAHARQSARSRKRYLSSPCAAHTLVGCRYCRYAQLPSASGPAQTSCHTHPCNGR